MKFKNDKQRKAVMATLQNGRKIQVTPRLKSMTFNQLNKSGVKLKPKMDSDGDGIINMKDCRPLDPKRQGILHNIQLARLKRMEEHLERKREKELRKLSDLHDEVKLKRSVAKRSGDIKGMRLHKKQIVLAQMKDEHDRIKALTSASLKARREIFALSKTGTGIRRTKEELGKVKRKAVRAGQRSVKIIKATNRFLRKRTTKRAFRKIGNFINSL